IWWVMLIKSIWVIFPYVCSFVALIALAVPINKELREYKIEQELELKKRLIGIRERLENEPASNERKDLRENYEFQQNRRKDLYAMRTWPFSLGANLKYLSIVATSLFTHVSAGAAKWLSSLSGSHWE